MTTRSNIGWPPMRCSFLPDPSMDVFPLRARNRKPGTATARLLVTGVRSGRRLGEGGQPVHIHARTCLVLAGLLFLTALAAYIVDCAVHPGGLLSWYDLRV